MKDFSSGSHFFIQFEMSVFRSFCIGTTTSSVIMQYGLIKLRYIVYILYIIHYF